jgi:hypothetical protein
MAFDVFSQDQIRNIILSVEHAHRTSPRKKDAYSSGYSDGHNDALASIALAFGIIPERYAIPDAEQSGD